MTDIASSFDVQSVPQELRHWTVLEIERKLDDAEKAAIMFFEAQAPDRTTTAYFENGWIFINKAHQAIQWKLKFGGSRELGQCQPLYTRYRYLLRRYYTGFE